MCGHQTGGGPCADMMSTACAHGKLNPRIGNPLETHNNPGSRNQKRNVVLDGAKIGDEK